MTQLAKAGLQKQAVATINRYKKQIELALPSHLSVDRFASICITAVTRNPTLAQCDPKTLIGSIIQASTLGLEPDGTLGMAYLVPYKNQVTLQIGYRGFIELARRSGTIKSIRARTVDAADDFSFQYGMHETIEHIPSPNPTGDITHVYGIAEYKEGGYSLEVMSRAQVEEIQKSVRNKGNVWRDHWGEMARKTVIRRLFKYLPVSVELLGRAAQIDEYNEAGIDTGASDIIVDEYATELEDERAAIQAADAEVVE